MALKKLKTRLGATALAVGLVGNIAFISTMGEPVASAASTITGPLEVVSYQPEGSPMYQRYQSLAKDFEALYPGVKITLTFGGGSGEPPIAARYRADSPPDVNPSIAGPDGPFAKAGSLLDLTSAMQTQLPDYGSTWQNAMYPGVVPYLKNSANGKIFTAPESVTTIQFFYNKGLFDQLGLKVPKTLTALFTVSDKLKAAGVAPFAVTGTFNFYMQFYYDYLLLRYAGAPAVLNAIGGPTIPKAERTKFSSVHGASLAAYKLEQMVKRGYFMSGFQSTDFTAAQLAFFQGKTGMILMGSWLKSEMSGKIPAGFKLATFPFPKVAGARGDQIGQFGNVQLYEVAAHAQNPDAAVAWLKFLANKKNQTSYVLDQGAISAYKGIPGPAGLSETAAALSTGGKIVPFYFNLFSDPAAIQNAYQLPIAKLFFGKERAASLVTDISKGLVKANALG